MKKAANSRRTPKRRKARNVYGSWIEFRNVAPLGAK
jgi:hypothetical protein